MDNTVIFKNQVFFGATATGRKTGYSLLIVEL
jgi:hypothetical protein